MTRRVLERTAARIFRSVFGAKNVYEHVTIRDGSKDIAGEIDVLVAYGEFILVVQAKSKRVTLKARAGDTEALKTDFEGAIQAPYRQSLDCAELIKKGLIVWPKMVKSSPSRPFRASFPL